MVIKGKNMTTKLQNLMIKREKFGMLGALDFLIKIELKKNNIKNTCFIKNQITLLEFPSLMPMKRRIFQMVNSHPVIQ